MKNLQEVIERSDYVKATQKLKTACQEIAGELAKKMEELDQRYNQ